MVKIVFYDPDKDDTPRPRKHSPKHKKASGFTMDWIAELGWDGNPFTAENFGVAGLEEERKEINLFFVKNKTFGVIKGAEGMGKSSLLAWLAEEIQDHRDMDGHFIDAAAGSDVDFLEAVWKPFSGMFGGTVPDDNDTLLTAIKKKKRGRYVLLVDNADHLEDMGRDIIKTLLTIDSSIIITATDPKGFPKDELGITLKKPDDKAYHRLLEERIKSVGGEEIRPFTSSVVKRMAKDTKNVREFLSLAEEAAINIALKHATLDEDVSAEELAEQEEAIAEKKKGIQQKDEPKKSERKRKYDELIESLIEE